MEGDSVKRSDIIRTLLNKNANVHLKNNKGIKPKDINNIIDDEDEFKPSPNKRRRIDNAHHNQYNINRNKKGKRK